MNFLFINDSYINYEEFIFDGIEIIDNNQGQLEQS